MFSEYLKRQFSHRGNVPKQLGISKSTLYRRLSHPENITLGEFRLMIEVGELEEQKVMDYLYRRSK